MASHLSHSQIAAITNGEYVDLASLLPFSSLLRDRVNSNLKLQVGNEDLTIPLPSPAQRPKITSIDRWLDAFAIYSSVILYSYPSRRVGLISHQQLIRESARKFPGMAWYVYDVEFRRRASHNLSKNNGGSGMPSFTWIRLRAYQRPSFVSHVPVATTLRIFAHSLPGSRTLPAQTLLTRATISTTGFPVPAPPADTSATNLDAQEPILKRIIMISPTPDPSQSQLAALAIPPEAVHNYLSKLSPSSYLHDHPDRAHVDNLLTGLT